MSDCDGELQTRIQTDGYEPEDLKGQEQSQSAHMKEKPVKQRRNKYRSIGIEGRMACVQADCINAPN